LTPPFVGSNPAIPVLEKIKNFKSYKKLFL